MAASEDAGSFALKLIAKRYRVESEIASGGMSTVWLGHDTQLGREVAVKIMSKDLAKSRSAKARFEREAMAAAQLQSLHVVRIFDYGVEGDIPYIVMELLGGETLSKRLRRDKRMTVGETLTVFRQLCKALTTAHNASLVHRDLKPGNIALAHEDDEVVVKVLDFGIVKSVAPASQAPAPDSEVTRVGQMVGTVQYMSPEQALGKELDHRSDLWSASVIAFVMLTGDNPFMGESMPDIVLNICKGAPPTASEHLATLPPSVDAFFEKAFAPKPEDRFQSALALRLGLERACQGIVGAADEGLSAPAPKQSRPLGERATLKMPKLTLEEERAFIAEKLGATPSDAPTVVERRVTPPAEEPPPQKKERPRPRPRQPKPDRPTVKMVEISDEEIAQARAVAHAALAPMPAPEPPTPEPPTPEPPKAEPPPPEPPPPPPAPPPPAVPPPAAKEPPPIRRQAPSLQELADMLEEQRPPPPLIPPWLVVLAGLAIVVVIAAAAAWFAGK